jgi:hypothetical protein
VLCIRFADAFGELSDVQFKGNYLFTPQFSKYLYVRTPKARALLRKEKRESQGERCGKLLTSPRPVQSFE